MRLSTGGVEYDRKLEHRPCVGDIYVCVCVCEGVNYWILWAVVHMSLPVLRGMFFDVGIVQVYLKVDAGNHRTFIDMWNCAS